MHIHLFLLRFSESDKKEREIGNNVENIYVKVHAFKRGLFLFLHKICSIIAVFEGSQPLLFAMPFAKSERNTISATNIN